MPIFHITCHQKAGTTELRGQVRPKHMEYIDANKAIVKVAGGILVDGKPDGAIFVIEADNIEAATSFAKNEPYCTEGVFDRHDIVQFHPAVGEWVAAH